MYYQSVVLLGEKEHSSRQGDVQPLFFKVSNTIVKDKQLSVGNKHNDDVSFWANNKQTNNSKHGQNGTGIHKSVLVLD
jgi:hypothetical protein